MNPQRVRLDVPDDGGDVRLDRFLAERVPGRTRSALRRLVDDGRVRVDGRTAAKPGLTLRGGERIEVDLPAEAPAGPGPEAIPLEVPHEDEHLLVVVKPAGLVVHPGHGRPDGTLVNALLGRGTRLSAVGAPDRPGIVQRLDEGTSGLLVVAKDDATHHALARALARREMEKRYFALVWGRPAAAEGTIERAIGRSRANPIKMAVGGTRGPTRAALTVYRTVETMPGFAALDVDLLTGRTHQIRVHLQSIGHPVVGDQRYGGRAWRGIQDPLKRKALREFDRLALHAARLAFRHPTSGEPLCFEAPLPAEIRSLLATLRRTP